MSGSPVPRFVVTGVPGIPEVRPGDDLAALIDGAVAAVGESLVDGDIVVVTSKIVSKAEGRIRTGVDRDDAIDDETARVVAEWTTPRGRTRIAETRHGFVMAAAGVDASNVQTGSVVLLPEDPDRSARELRAALASRSGARLGVVVTDTAGRVWRNGVVDFAVGAAGVVSVDDLRGRRDPYGNDLGVTIVAVADELASATELVRTKLAGVPVAIVRGLPQLVLDEDDADAGAAALIRPAAEDRFRLGTPEAMREAVFARRDADAFDPRPVPEDVLARAVAAAAAAPGPAGANRRWRIVRVDQRPEGLRPEGLGPDAVPPAPVYYVPYVEGPPDPAAWLHLGAAVENLMIALAADGIGSRWVVGAPDRGEALRDALRLPETAHPAGLVAVGFPVDLWRRRQKRR